MTLDIRDLSVHYAPGLTAVHDLSLGIGEAEIVALVGESGCGKSTLAKALLGLLPESSTVTGSARLIGEELVGRSEREWKGVRGPRIGVVPQGAMSGLNPVRRIGAQLVEMIGLHTSVAGASARSRAGELLTAVRLDEELLGAYPHQLSGGMRQRVAIALALAGEPQLLVADEPTTGLDAVTQEHVLTLLTELRDRTGVAMLIVSHDLPGLTRHSDRVAVMYAGRLVELRAARAMDTDAQHPYTMGLVAASASVDPAAGWASVPGAAPALDAPLAGCRFAPRCPVAVSRCHLEEPELERSASAHVACHRTQSPDRPEYPAVPRTRARPEDSTLLVRAASVSVTFRTRHRKVEALRGVDLEIGHGEIVGLVGESGSGKSTLARVLLGLLKPSSGSIDIDGTDIATLRGRALRMAQQRIGFVHQDPYGSLHPAMTVSALVAEPLRLAGVPRRETADRVSAALTAAGLPVTPEFLGRYPARLSGGQRQRVSLARALASEPILLVADEATSMLDVSTRAGIAATLRSIAVNRGLAVLFVTHDLGEAVQSCDRIVVLKSGEVVEVGPPAHLVNHPAHTYTDALLGAARRRIA